MRSMEYYLFGHYGKHYRKKIWNIFLRVLSCVVEEFNEYYVKIYEISFSLIERNWTETELKELSQSR